MIISAFDWESVKTFLNGYGYIFAIVAAALAVILLITIIAAAAHSAKLKRENRKLRERAASDKKRLADIARNMTLADERKTETVSEPEVQKPNEAQSVGESVTDEKAEQAAAEETKAEAEDESQEQTQTVQAEETFEQEQAADEEIQSDVKEEKPKKTPPAPRTAEQKNAAAQKSAATRAALARSNPVQSEDVQNKYTVKYDRDKGNWIILKAGNSRPTRRVATKAEALSIARELAGKSDAALTVHKKDGKFQKQ